MDIDPDKTPGEPGGIRWMTYGQIAAVRGISRDSVERTVRRKGWRRLAGNDGLVRVAVPVEWMENSQGDNQPGNPRRDKTSIASAIAVAIDALEQAHKREIAALREQLERERERADTAITLIDGFRLERDSAAARADRLEQALEAERERADAVRERLDQAQAAARVAEDAADVLRAAILPRRAQGLLARLVAAWRGE